MYVFTHIILCISLHTQVYMFQSSHTLYISLHTHYTSVFTHRYASVFTHSSHTLIYASAFTHVCISLHTSHTRVQLVLWKCIYQYSHTVRHLVRIPVHTNCRLARQNTLRCVCVTSLRHSSSPLCDILAIQNLRLCVTPLRYKSVSFCDIFAIQIFVLV